jgi:N-formylglutamate deformylase
MANIPSRHDSAWIPDALRPQFVLSGDELANELLKMTDHFTAELFSRNIPPEQAPWSKVSRLLVDVERFDDDNQEEVAKDGMKAVYTKSHTSNGLPRSTTTAERDNLIREWYIPYHDAFTNKVARVLTRFEVSA